MPLDGSTKQQVVSAVPRAHLAFVWPQCSPHIARALARDKAGRYAPDDVLKELMDGHAALWIAWNYDAQEIEAAFVTQVMAFPRLKELKIWLIGGTGMSRWAEEARRVFEAFAKAEGCSVISGYMRKGWIRIGGEGYRQTGVMFEKQLA